MVTGSVVINMITLIPYHAQDQEEEEGRTNEARQTSTIGSVHFAAALVLWKGSRKKLAHNAMVPTTKLIVGYRHPKRTVMPSLCLLS